MLSKIIGVFLSAALFSTGLSAKPDQLGIEGYSIDPVITAIFEPAEVAVRTTQLNNWLNYNADKLAGEKKKEIREHLYYLINSHIKHRRANNQSLFPKEPDLILSMLFSWSENLGVFGGSLIHNHLKMTGWPTQEPLNKLPEDWSLSLNDGLFSLTSKKGNWKTSYPYYFMLADARSFNNTAGQPTSFISFSTGSAHHTDGKGYSQATLMLIFSPKTKLKDFRQFWVKAMELPKKPEKPVNVRKNNKRFYIFDKASRLHKELVVWQEPQGSFAVAYFGMDGTYQHNRQHFLDFLASINAAS